MFTLTAPPRRLARLALIVPLAALVVVACEHNLGPTPGPLATITVTPNPTLPIGALQPFTATGRDAKGNLVAITPTWSIVAGGGSINSSSGLFTAGNVAGTFTLTVQATSGGISGRATVIVTSPGGLATIMVTPNPGGTVVNGTIQYSAEGQDANGTVIPIVPAATWSVVSGGGTINSASGLFTAGTTPGTFFNTVRATSGGISGFATAVVTSSTPPPPLLGSAATYGILAGTTVTCAGAPGAVNANVGVSPGTTTTGFPPCTISGSTNLGNAAAATAQSDLTTAYDNLVARPCGTVVTPADLGGRTLPPGVYCVASSLAVTGTVTLNGPANGVWVFQIGSTLTTGTNAIIALSGGAQASNVWWQVGSSATLGTGTTFRGNILAFTTITLAGNGTMCGRALARNGAVSLSATNNSITLPPTCS
jgi:hypothetical protein